MSLGKIGAAIDALSLGKKLADSALWKDRAAISNVFASLALCIAPFIPQFSDLDQNVIRDWGLNIGWGAFAVFSLCNAYLHTATSDSVGFKPKSDSHPKSGQH